MSNGQTRGSWFSRFRRPQMDPYFNYFAQDEVDFLRDVVARHFQVYDVKLAPDMAAFFVNISMDRLEGDFEALRLALKEKDYIPMLRQEGVEYLLYVARKQVKRYRGVKFNVALLIATILSTTFAGMFLWAGYADSEEIFTLEVVGNAALYFSLPLMAILGIHEMGHYLMARRHKVAASLPFFMPLPPPLFILGTFGAVISIREPIPSRKALMDIGFAGPIAGFVVGLPVALLGLWLTNAQASPVPINAGDLGASYMIGFPLIYYPLLMLVPIRDGVLMHPTAFAGWAAIFVTALNLLPASQLDGGHVIRALLGKKARYASVITIVFLAFSMLAFNYSGWLFLIVLLFFFGLSHPPPLNDVIKIDWKRKMVGVVAIIMLVTCFTPVPFMVGEPTHDFEVNDGSEAIGSLNITLAANSTASASFWLENTGNTFDRIIMTYNADNLSENWSVGLSFMDAAYNGTGNLTITLNDDQAAQVNATIAVPDGTRPGLYEIPINIELTDSRGEIRVDGRTTRLRLVVSVA